MFWENYSELCKQKNISPNKAAAEIGVSSGSVTAWKNGRLPRSAVLVRIAEYFSVSVEDLLSKKEKPAETGELDAKFNEIWGDLTEEQKEAAIAFMRAFKK